MAELAALLQTEIPEGRSHLTDSHTNLERVAEYCEANYFQSENKRLALESTKNYTTQSLASVAYQINTLAYNFLQLLELQTMQLAEMEGQMNHIAQTVAIHKEKVARREIGVLTANKVTNRQYKIIAPANPEKPIKYVRKSIDYTTLDDIGHGARWNNGATGTPRGRRSGSAPGAAPLPAPTTKPPTPPAVVRSASAANTGTLGRGTLGKSSREYRTPPAVAPPQVPSHYAPNYPRRPPGYSTLPVAQPQVGMVHPNQHQPSNYTQDMHSSMPPPPSPLIGSDGDHSQHSMSLPGQRASVSSGGGSGGGSARGGSVSPPLPPPPLDDELVHDGFGRHHHINNKMGGSQYTSAVPAIVPDEEDLPGWVPKNYIEKVVAIYDYYADKEDELSFQESSVIYVLKKNDDGWWEGVMDGVTGLFPGNYVEPCV
ncbi:abl interactor 2 [Aricia agestis]|uniref:abl interactor 2 n=1 Tax=Aricia agestis TaxID=91739 RepID=UPI001C20BCA5|nr:abl interactor 2 [Aricia agestis]XP_041970920.1 abl interactor 2 [Aricia agestis]XP_041970921.1 abl interactor 2 [Aricia agestis]XP_041970922.1 abl interactor 2 [Aricia agestis]XP_041970923.1 abl interactor 2 [Aricia agestis]